MNDQPYKPTESDQPLDDRPSKTQRKKVSHDLQKLGLELSALSDARLKALPLDEGLLDALMLTKTIRSHEGRRRHLQYIGKLMRKADPAPLEKAAALAQLVPAKASLELHEAERWRSELLAKDSTLTDWVEQYPQTDVTALRTLIRNARKDASLAPEQRSGRAFRELFQWIKMQQLEARGEPMAPSEVGEDDADE